NFPLLYLPVHIVWLELIIHPVALLGFQRESRQEKLAANPDTSSRLFGRAAWFLLLLSGLIVTIGITGIYVERSASAWPEQARSAAIAMLVFANAFVATALSWPLNRFGG